MNKKLDKQFRITAHSVAQFNQVLKRLNFTLKAKKLKVRHESEKNWFNTNVNPTGDNFPRGYEFSGIDK